MFSSQSSNFCWDVTVQPNRHAHCHGSEQVLYYNKSVTNPPTCGSIKRFHRNKNTAGLACRYNQPWHRSLWVTERERLEEKPPSDRTHASCKLPHADISVPSPNYVAPIQTNVTFQSTCKSSFASGQPLEAMRRTRVCHLSHRSRYPSPDHRGAKGKWFEFQSHPTPSGHLDWTPSLIQPFRTLRPPKADGSGVGWHAVTLQWHCVLGWFVWTGSRLIGSACFSGLLWASFVRGALLASRVRGTVSDKWLNFKRSDYTNRRIKWVSFVCMGRIVITISLFGAPLDAWFVLVDFAILV